MNLEQMDQLLTLVQNVDNRRIDDATVLVWHEILGDLAYDDCHTAVTRHFATSDAYLMPVHIRRLVDDIRRDRAARDREERLAIMASQVTTPGPTRDRTETIEQLIAELRAKLPSGSPDSLRYASGYWREQRQARARQAHAEPNPHYDPTALVRLSRKPVADLTPTEPETPRESE